MISLEEEIWKTIEEFPNYEVSNLGRVRNRKTGRIMRLSENERYLNVTMHANNKAYRRGVHRLVALAFIPPVTGMTQVNHKDCDRHNNKVDNLEWSNASENQIHAVANGRRTLKPPSLAKKRNRPVRIRENGECFETIADCADVVGCARSSIWHILNEDPENGTAYGYHYDYITKEEYKAYLEDKLMGILYNYQLDAVRRMSNGCILNGGVGSGKSRTGLYYYFKEQGGCFEQEYIPMNNPKDLYIITTALKRDSLEFEKELTYFRISTDPEMNLPYTNKVVIDSWNKIQHYVDIKDSFFIFDEDRVTGNGAWVKAFLKITKNNDWIILSATPGDTWLDYIPVFIANGFYRNKTEFNREHVQYSQYCKFPKVERYYNTGRLVRLRNKILIDMDFKRHTIPHHEDVYTTYDFDKYRLAMKNRWDPYNNCPIEQAAGLCYVLRRIVNSDESRALSLLELYENHPKMIVFYSFDYELDILKSLYYGDDVIIAEWNGHKHEPVPDTDRWVYLVNYNAGAEGWNCIKTDTIVFYSQNYSYKTMSQAAGRIDRLNSPFLHLYYFHLKSRSGIDLAISRALRDKKKFNERKFTNWDK